MTSASPGPPWAEEVAKGSRENQRKIEGDPKLNSDQRLIAAMSRHVQFNEVRQEQMWASLCIASDDSRLGDPRGPKGK